MNHMTMQQEPAAFQRWINYSLATISQFSDDDIRILSNEYFESILNCLATDEAMDDSDDELFRCTRSRVCGAQLYALGRRLRDMGYELKRDGERKTHAEVESHSEGKVNHALATVDESAQTMAHTGSAADVFSNPVQFDMELIPAQTKGEQS